VWRSAKRRLEVIGRHVDVRAFVERSEVTGKDGGPIQVEDLSKIELAKRRRHPVGKRGPLE
jgi:hypothetical protein